MSITPGQAAFEVAQARYSPKNRLSWEKIHPLHREHWEAEAQAAIDTYLAAQRGAWPGRAAEILTEGKP